MVNYRPIHLLTYFQKLLGHKRGDFPNAERIGDSTVSLPLYPDMPVEHVDIVSGALRVMMDGGVRTTARA
jgi:UDP-4-amino-4-deoxy-L-arabinose-oxoglutarate aminotransferase